MKKLQTGLMAVAALAGISGAFAFTHKTTGNVIYGELVSGTYVYATSAPDPHSLTCQTLTGKACTFTSTKTVGWFNLNNQNTFPPAQATTPQVAYTGGIGSIYQ